jgi:hypothetical protein
MNVVPEEADSTIMEAVTQIPAMVVDFGVAIRRTGVSALGKYFVTRQQ